MANQFVNYVIEENIATITINNPPANALSMPVMKELNSTLDELSKNNDAKAIIVTGAGAFFVAGADIKEIVNISSKKEGMEATTKGQEIISRLENSIKPTIAAINGVCLGGGMELAMACHMRVVGERVRLGQPEINLGIIPGFGGTQRLPRLIGKARAMELILTGDMIMAQEAKALGLVNKVVPDAEVLKQAKGIAKKIVTKGAVAVSAGIKAIQEGYKKSVEDGLKLESELFGSLCETEDMKEGLKAFIEKRQPKFRDK
ncbi:MAG: enoyl-CoA hydratase [Nitrospirae bacterium]|nr:enoyl-CoA hydratase [Nitrospirota bacterium]